MRRRWAVALGLGLASSMVGCKDRELEVKLAVSEAKVAASEAKVAASEAKVTECDARRVSLEGKVQEHERALAAAKGETGALRSTPPAVPPKQAAPRPAGELNTSIF